MLQKTTIPQVSFYFVRHGETDWNKLYQTLCNEDDIPLNDSGKQQANNVCKLLGSLNITKIYSSPLMRAKQTAEIINSHLAVNLEFHEALGQILPEKIAKTFETILESSNTILIVSHGEVYRILLKILNAQTFYPNAKNCGLYLFNPPNNISDQWSVYALSDED